MQLFNSINQIATECKLSKSLVDDLINHLSKPFNSLEDASKYWIENAISLYVLSANEHHQLEHSSIAEYTDNLKGEAEISLYLMGDAGQGVYILKEKKS